MCTMTEDKRNVTENKQMRNMTEKKGISNVTEIRKHWNQPVRIIVLSPKFSKM